MNTRSAKSGEEFDLQLYTPGRLLKMSAEHWGITSEGCLELPLPLTSKMKEGPARAGTSDGGIGLNPDIIGAWSAAHFAQGPAPKTISDPSSLRPKSLVHEDLNLHF